MDVTMPMQQDTLQRLYTSLRILRNRHGCQLPVEIFAFPQEMQSSPFLRSQIEALGNVEFKEVSTCLFAWRESLLIASAFVTAPFESQTQHLEGVCPVISESGSMRPHVTDMSDI